MSGRGWHSTSKSNPFGVPTTPMKNTPYRRAVMAGSKIGRMAGHGQRQQAARALNMMRHGFVNDTGAGISVAIGIRRGFRNAMAHNVAMGWNPRLHPRDDRGRFASARTERPSRP